LITFACVVATSGKKSHGGTRQGKATMTSRASSITSAPAHRQDFHGQGHGVFPSAFHEKSSSVVGQGMAMVAIAAPRLQADRLPLHGITTNSPSRPRGAPVRLQGQRCVVGLGQLQHQPEYVHRPPSIGSHRRHEQAGAAGCGELRGRRLPVMGQGQPDALLGRAHLSSFQDMVHTVAHRAIESPVYA
jgi:hypothetical protein